MSERRGFARVPIDIEGHWQAHGPRARAQATDVSMAGARVRLGAPLRELGGEWAELLLPCEGASEPLRLVGQVLRADPSPRDGSVTVAMRFVPGDAPHRRALANALLRWNQRRASSPA